MSSTLKKVIFILILTLVSLYISLPGVIPLKFSIGKFSIDRTVVRPNLNIKVGRVNVGKSFDLKLGLDLAGGSHLVFEADVSTLPVEKKEEALISVKSVIERRVNLFGVSEPNVQLSSFEGKDRVIVELPGITDPAQAVELIGKTAQLVFAQIIEKPDSQEVSYTLTDLTGADLKKASVVFDQTTGKPAVNLEFTDAGAKKFEDLTGNNVGRVVPILLDNEVISAPVVKEKIIGGQAQISGEFTLDDAKNLSIQLNAGALPLTIKLVEQRSVGAVLGAESVEKSVRAGVVGLIMVVLFMVLVYGKLGLVADVSLMVFGVITLALYKLIPVVLTLPGIAGFLLSVGMAVDSNILIFERFKEEKLKRNYVDALEVSFGRAWDSIRDANIATLVTAFILANPLDWNFLHTSGPVRGFAITLALGIGISLFTGIFVSRNLLRLFIKDKSVS